MKSSMKGMGDSFNSQLQKQVSEIVTTLNETKEKTEGQLSGLSTQMGGKADSMFLDDLECAPVSLLQKTFFELSGEENAQVISESDEC